MSDSRGGDRALVAAEAVGRLSGIPADRLNVVVADPADGRDSYRVQAHGDRLHIQASSAGTAVAGYASYARTTGIACVSRFGTRPVDRPLPTGDALERASAVALRGAHNTTVAGYTTPFFDWSSWEHELDLLAAAGMNIVNVTVGQEIVWLRCLQEFGYNEAEILRWITPPSHQPWQWMNNIQGSRPGMTRRLIEDRADLGRRILSRLQEYSIAAILPGASGTVPPGFGERNLGALPVPQGKWFMDMMGPMRPDWLPTDSAAYSALAAAFYSQQAEWFGRADLWAVDLVHEGGTTGETSLSDAARGVEAAMRRANPAYTWVLQAWMGNPASALLESLDREHLLVLDLTGDEWRHARTFCGAPWVCGVLPNYGGRPGLYGDLASIAAIPQTLWAAQQPAGQLRGFANMAEGVSNNPVVWDLLGDVAWSEADLDLQAWLPQWTASRYGAVLPAADEAWRILLGTAYAGWWAKESAAPPVETLLALSGGLVDATAVLVDSLPPMDSHHFEMAASIDSYAGTDSVIAALPSLQANQASTIGPRALGYQPGALVPALRLLLTAAGRADTPGLRYDLVDVTRQVLDDHARLLLPTIAAAVDERAIAAFDARSSLFLELVRVQDEVLATHEAWLIGRWLADARQWASTPEEASLLVDGAKRLITSWGDAESFPLTEYAMRSWAGLVGTYYRERWSLWFDQVRRAMVGAPTTPIDWYEVAEEWIGRESTFTTTASGSPAAACAAALAVVARVGVEIAAAAGTHGPVGGPP